MRCEKSIKLRDLGPLFLIMGFLKSTVPELRSRYSKIDRYTKLRKQVKQACTANKNGRYSGAAHLL